ncbi:MAG: class I SAM-dependent methyltransferase [Deltaproteobacteria bacterium]|nr:class I SAM-dependent methyltransferase [Deltaproteobacteria bacterium]
MQREQFELHASLESRHWWFVGRQRVLRAIVERLGAPVAGAEMFEFGCGTGGTLAAIGGGYRCAGVDPDEAGIAAAQQRFPQHSFAVWQPGEPLPEALGRAEVVLMLDVLEHIERSREALSAVITAMKPGAHLLITVPADMSIWSGHDEHFGHYRRYDAEMLRWEWSDRPVEVRLLSHFNALLHPVVSAIRRLNRLRGRSSGAAGTDLSMPPEAANGLLTRLFAGERRALVAAIDTGEPAYARGVSLVALLRKQP